jgi:hypothetical protein
MLSWFWANNGLCCYSIILRNLQQKSRNSNFIVFYWPKYVVCTNLYKVKNKNIFNSNILYCNVFVFFFLFVLSCKQSNVALLRKFFLAYVRSTHLSQLIKSHNKLIYTLVIGFKNIYIHWIYQHFQKLINMRCLIKNVIVTAVLSITLSRRKCTCWRVIVCSNLAG